MNQRRHPPLGRPSTTAHPSLEFLESRRLLAAGDLDPTFGGGGKVVIDDGNALGNAVAVQEDGKILLGVDSDFTDLPDNSPPFNTVPTARVLRLNPDGSPDPSFGGGDGVAEVDAGTGSETIFGMALQPDGKVLVRGYANHKLYIARLNADGSADSSFGENGVLMLTREGLTLIGGQIAIQSDGRIILAGSVSPGLDGKGQDIAVMRLMPDGSWDSSFGDNGIARKAMGWTDLSYDVALHANGKIVVTARAMPGGAPIETLPAEKLLVLRFNPDGSLDTSFSGDGVFEDDMDGNSGHARHVAIGIDGSILVMGTLLAEKNFGKVFLQKINPDGSRDTTFGDGGDGNHILGGPIEVQQMVVQPDGKVLLVGFMPKPGHKFGDGGPTDFAVMRLTADGMRDAEYGQRGLVRIRIGGSSDLGMSAALQRDGKLVVAGYTHRVSNESIPSEPYNGEDLAVVRLEGGVGSAGSKFGKLRRGVDQQKPRGSKRIRKGKSSRPVKQRTPTANPRQQAPPVAAPRFSTLKIAADERENDSVFC
jgi:uncharacterized delta-60 repeat protein